VTNATAQAVRPNYKILGMPFSSWLFFLFPMRWFAGIRIKPAQLDRAVLERLSGGRPIVFVMERFQLLDLCILNIVLRRFGVAPVKREARSNSFLDVAFLAIRMQVLRIHGLERRDTFSEYLDDILKNDLRVKEVGICLLPVSVFWSRGAERPDRNILIRGLFPDDGNANFLQKILLFISHRGNVDIHFGNPHIVTTESLPELSAPAVPGANSEAVQDVAGVELSSRDRALRYRRVLAAELNRERTAALGPTLYDFSAVANWILGDAETEKMIAAAPSPKRAQKRAYAYLREIAASYNYTTIRALEAALDFVWTRIFKGVRVRNFAAVREVARTGRILWMPCHRSHLDYLLLSYLVRKEGLVCPHIAAGVNLSFWPAGPILRRGGAFFMRRSFSGNKLYTRIFTTYVDYLMHNGYPIEFFHEGGRSRIGKLMTPRYGLTSICVRSVLRRKAAATYVVPVFVGYDKVMEDDAYAREVSGAKKHNESVWQLLRSVRYLFSNYGRVDVSFGTPIHFGDFWKDYVVRHESMGQVLWSSQDESSRAGIAALEDSIDTRHPMVQSFVESLGLRVNEGINAAAVASGTSIMAVVVLALRGEALDASTLAVRFEHAAWMVDTIGRELGWKISNSFSAVDDGYAFADAPQLHDSDQHVVTSVIQTQEALAAFRETLESCLGWGFLTKVDNEPSESSAAGLVKSDNDGGIHDTFRYRRSDSKFLNLYWYRGTVFHIFAIPGIIGKILQKYRDKGSDSVPYSALLAAFDAVRLVWKLELFWPRDVPSEKLLDAGISLLQGLGVASRNEGLVSILRSDDVPGSLDFVAGIIQTEKEIYGLLLAAAIKLSESKGSFRRDELIQHAYALHRGAFLRSLVSTPASLTHVYGGRSFDALVNVAVFVPRPGNTYRMSFGALQTHIEFFDISELNKVHV
jgi:glycerol-3-phosphate O-acyltransferase